MNHNRAVATSLVIVIFVVIVVAAGIGTYVAFNASGKPTLSSETSSPSSSSSSVTATSPLTSLNVRGTNSTSTISSTSATSSTTTSQLVSSSSTIYSTSFASTTTSSFNLSSLPNPFAMLPDLFGNFSSMTLRESINESSSNSSIAVLETYRVVGTPTINSSKYYEVNITLSGFLQGKSSSNSSLLAWFAPNGTATIVDEAGHNYTGFLAESFSISSTEVLVSSQAFLLDENATEKATLSHFQVGNTVPVKFGPTTLNVTTYNITAPMTLSSSNQSSTDQSIVKIGTISQGNLVLARLVVYLYFGSASTATLVEVTSLTRAT